jgi:hypothetical protein
MLLLNIAAIFNIVSPLITVLALQLENSQG